MARNEEKAQSMLFRFREVQRAELGLSTAREKRPSFAGGCTNLGDAERFRHQIMREISHKVEKIQDSGLSDFEVRDLNDQINKMFKQKRHWEYHIMKLGGPDYRRSGPKMYDTDGKMIAGDRGYRYFGRAKDLPGIRETLYKEAKLLEEGKDRAELLKNVRPYYYGYHDELSGKLLETEKEHETIGQRELKERWMENVKKQALKNTSNIGQAPLPTQNVGNDPFYTSQSMYYSDIPLPDEVEQYMVESKKRELLNRYVV